MQKKIKLKVQTGLRKCLILDMHSEFRLDLDPNKKENDPNHWMKAANIFLSRENCFLLLYKSTNYRDAKSGYGGPRRLLLLTPSQQKLVWGGIPVWAAFRHKRASEPGYVSGIQGCGSAFIFDGYESSGGFPNADPDPA